MTLCPSPIQTAATTPDCITPQIWGATATAINQLKNLHQFATSATDGSAFSPGAPVWLVSLGGTAAISSTPPTPTTPPIGVYAGVNGVTHNVLVNGHIIAATISAAVTAGTYLKFGATAPYQLMPTVATDPAAIGVALESGIDGNCINVLFSGETQNTLATISGNASNTLSGVFTAPVATPAINMTFTAPANGILNITQYSLTHVLYSKTGAGAWGCDTSIALQRDFGSGWITTTANSPMYESSGAGQIRFPTPSTFPYRVNMLAGQTINIAFRTAITAATSYGTGVTRQWAAINYAEFNFDYIA